MSDNRPTDVDNLDLPGLRRLAGLIEEQIGEVEQRLLPAVLADARAAFEVGDAEGVTAAFRRKAELVARLEKLRADHGRVRDALRDRGEVARREWREWLDARLYIWQGEDRATIEAIDKALTALESALARLAGLSAARQAREGEAMRRHAEAVEQSSPFSPDSPAFTWPEVDRSAVAERLARLLRGLAAALGRPVG